MSTTSVLKPKDKFQWTDDKLFEFMNYLWSNDKFNKEAFVKELNFFKEAKSNDTVEYEIVSFLDNYGTLIKWQGKEAHNGLNYKEWVDGCLSYNYKIKELKRLSDNEIFSVDEITGQGQIGDFMIQGNGDLLIGMNGKYKFGDECYSLSELTKKVYKPVLLQNEVFSILKELKDAINDKGCCGNSHLIAYIVDGAYQKYKPNQDANQ